MLDRIPFSHLLAVVTFAFLLGPFVVLIGASLDGGLSSFARFPPRDLSLHWYAHIPAPFWAALRTSFLVACAVALLSTLVGMAAAIGLMRSGIGGQQVFQAFFRIPVQIPLVVTGAVFLEFYFRVAAQLGIELLYSYGGLVIAHLFIAIPYSVGSICAVLARLDPALEEAALSLGASRWSAFRRVVLPAIRPGVVISLFYAFIVSFGDVPVSLFLVNSEITTFPVRLFQDMQFDFHPTILAVSSLILGLSFVLVLGAQRLAGMSLVNASSDRS